jgi:hypothetical protein
MPKAECCMMNDGTRMMEGGAPRGVEGRLGGGLARWVGVALLLMGVWSAWGCGAYQLRGKVVAGLSSSVEVVSSGDARLDGPGIAGARVEGWIDPERLDRERLPARTSGPDGGFAIPVSSTGAGLLEYEVWVSASAPQRAAASASLGLPGADRRLLITLGPGDGRSRQRYGDPMRETLELAEPYLNH